MKSTQPIRPNDIKGHASWLAVVKCYLKCQKVMNSKLAAMGLTTAQHELLMHIYHKPGSSQQQISDRLLVVKSNTSAIINKLIDRGLIQRQKNASDGRQYDLYLTAAGEQQLQQSMGVQIEVIQAMTAVMSDEEIQANLEIMERVYHSLDQLL